MITVQLNFKKTLTGVAGFPFGQKIFEEQVKPLMSKDLEPITIVFPDQIERVASSFIQGFFSSIVEKVGYSELDKMVIIQAKTKDLEDNIRGNIR